MLDSGREVPLRVVIVAETSGALLKRAPIATSNVFNVPLARECMLSKL
jgi:hypothetical protein